APARQPRFRPAEIGLGLAQRGFRVVERLLSAGGGAQQILRAGKGLSGGGDRRLFHDQVSLLQIVIEREQQVTWRNFVALAHLQRLDAALLIGADIDDLGLDPALQGALIAVAASCEQQRQHDERKCGPRCHAGLRGANKSSRWVFIIARTSMGSKRSNNPLQMIAIRPGAAMSCGKSTRPGATSPRAAARVSSARTAAMMRASTSR